MQEGKKYYVRIDTKKDTSNMTDKDFLDHFNYLKRRVTEHNIIGGGFADGPGGMIIFEAANREIAEKLAKEDPIVARGFYSYELREWKIALINK